MADNIILPGTGAEVGTETVAGAQVQQMKVLWGAVDTGTEIAVATPLPVVQTGTPALPTGASTSALQTTGNTSLSTIATNTPALGQALAAASVPVVLTAAQVVTLTPPTTVTANLGTLNGAATAAKQPALGTAGSASADVISVQGIASMIAFKVDGSAVTQPVSIAGSIALPTGASTSALQTTGNTSLSTIATNIPAQGQALAAASLPVVLTAAQITTLTPPTTVTANLGTLNGAATAANQSTGNTSLGTIATNTPALGQALAAASVPVVLTALQVTALTPPATVTANQGVPTSGGATIYRNLNTGMGVNIKSSAGQIFGWSITNQATTVRFVKLFNSSSAPTLGSGTPVMTLGIPPGGGSNLSFPAGIAFASGIGITSSQLIADNDATVNATNDVLVDLFYA